MKPSPEIAEQGLRAYEQAGAFQRLRRRHGLVFFYALSPLVLLLLGWVAGDLHRAALAYACLAGAILSALLTVWNWQRLAARHDRNLALLASLKREYGDDLPWLEVERHLAALEKLVSDLEVEKRGRTELDFGADEGPQPE